MNYIKKRIILRKQNQKYEKDKKTKYHTSDFARDPQNLQYLN